MGSSKSTQQQPGHGGRQGKALKVDAKNGKSQGVAGVKKTWPRGVTVSTLDSESSDRGSNPREALALDSLRPGLTDQQWLPRPHCDMSP